jgi:lysophospholipid acyltransferase (LPLAT)-like uncharacterized protein
VSALGHWCIVAISGTLRWQVDGWDNFASISRDSRRVIYTFWHGRIFLATYFWRHRGIVVMTSQNKDGEYIARVIRRLGYGAARGSSSRGGRRALAEMMQALRQKQDVGFTIDGPRGPRYVAKPGAVWLASRTGNAILPFHCSAQRKWVLGSWDAFEIPKPFSRALVLIAPPIYVPEDASPGQIDALQAQLQETLEKLQIRGDSHWSNGMRP